VPPEPAERADAAARKVIELWGKRVRVTHEQYVELREMGCDMSLYKVEDQITLTKG
jgi:hypothetical protein